MNFMDRAGAGRHGTRFARRSLFASLALPPLARAQAHTPAGKGLAMGCCGLDGLDDAELGSRLRGMRALGTAWVRFDVMWASVQAGGSSSWEWAKYDRLVTAIMAHGMKPLLILDTTPPWARPAGTSYWHPPANPAQFGRFAGACAKRYGAMGVHHYEIWNEPNIPTFWRAGPNAREYGRLLKAAYASIKANDPAAFVVSGGLSPAVTDGSSISPVDFLSALYADGLKPYFDAVGHHPYCAPVLPSEYRHWSAWSQMYRTQNNLRGVMSANDDAAKTIWMTEFGAPTNGPASGRPVSEAKQARIVAEAYRLAASYPWAGPLFLYSYKDRGTDPGDRENFYGIRRADGSRKQAYDAFAAAGSPRDRSGRAERPE